jgi:hypothetical protein
MKFHKETPKRAAALIIAFLLSSFSILAANTPTQLLFTTQPVNTSVGAGLTNVVVRLANNNGTSVAQSGIAISLALSKGTGLSGTTNVSTDASGKAVFASLKISQAGSGDTMLAMSSGLKSATSSAFNVGKDSTTSTLTSSTNFVVYGKSVTFTATVRVTAPASEIPTGTVIFKDGFTSLGTAAVNPAGIATFSTNRISASTISHTLTAVYSGDANFFSSTSGGLSLTASKFALTVTGLVANNKVYNASTSATLNFSNATLTTALAGDTVTLNITAAKGTFADKSVGTQKPVSVTGLALSGASSGNYSVLSPAVSANITPATLTVSGIIASNKIYDATTTATLNFINAKLAGVFSGDSVVLNTSAAQGAFANKNAGPGKTVQVSGVALTGTNAGNYRLTQPATTASITKRSLTLAAKGADKTYNGTTGATVALADNRLTGDVFSNSFTSATFASKNAGTNIVITVSGLAINGTDAANYALTATKTTASANITKAALTVSGLAANNKTYDATTVATLNFNNAKLTTIFNGDTVTLSSTAAKAAFANKAVGTNKTVSVSGLSLGGASAGNYALSQPVAAASITARTLAITALGVNKIYDGATNATVTLADNRVAGDVFTCSYAFAAFTSKNVGTNILINVSGLAIAGTDAINYYLPATNTTATAAISRAVLTVAAANLTRPYATTNPVLVAIYSGFVAGESLTNNDLTGSPTLTTAADTNSSVGTYPIAISNGSLVSTNYGFQFTNGVLTVTRAGTAALLATTVNPALTNQNITFAAQVKPTATTVNLPTGTIQFKCNGTNKLGGAVSLSSGQASLTVPAGSLGIGNVTITAEYTDPSGNFNSSTNSLMQSITASTTPPPPSKMSLVTSFASGRVIANLSGTANTTYIIQASTDLVHWTPIATNVADVNGSVLLIESNTMAYPSRYYRAYSPAPLF